MKCYHCGAEVEEGSVFCGNCGTKVLTACPDCGAPVNGNKFCRQCGKQLYEGKIFNRVQKARRDSNSSKISEDSLAASDVLWKRIVVLIGSICGCIAVLFSFLFVFFIGCEITSGQELAGSFGIDRNMDIIYMFGEAWEDFGHATDLLEVENMTLGPILCSLIGVPLGTVVFAGSMIALFVLFIICVVRYVAYFRGKPCKGIEKLTLVMYFLYALSAALIHMLVATSMQTTISGVKVAVGTGFNAATLSGLVIGGVMIGLFIFSRIIVRAKSLCSKRVIVPLVLNFCIIVIGAVIWALAQDACLGVSGKNTSLTGSFLSVLGGFALNLNDLGGAELPDAILTLVCLVCGYLALVALMSLLCVIMIKACKNIMEAGTEKQRPNLMCPIFLVVTATIALVMACLAFNDLGFEYFVDLIGLSSVTGSCVFGSIITILILSVILLVVAMADLVALKTRMNDGTLNDSDYASDRLQNDFEVEGAE